MSDVDHGYDCICTLCIAARHEREAAFIARRARECDLMKREEERERLERHVIDAAIAWYETSYDDVPQDVLEDTLSGAVIRLTAFLGKKAKAKR